MYDAGHPVVQKSIDETHAILTESLRRLSPLVILFYREQFFVEEEPFDSRLNTSRMADHFKKVGIESVSFDKGLGKTDLIELSRIFTDAKAYPSADLMKEELAKRHVSRVKINYIFYRKVTADDEIISKQELEKLKAGTPDGGSSGVLNDVVNKMAENILVEEVEKSASLEALLADPAKLSDDIINQDLALSKGGKTKQNNPGAHIAGQLNQFRNEVQKAAKNPANLSLPNLADAVYDLKKQLSQKIESQKQMGIYYENEAEILDEANALTDQVLVELLKDEYQKGAVSIQRLAQIIHRLVPDIKELKRIIPGLRKVLFAEGMSKADFVKLLRQLEKELQAENLTCYLQKGAENIGVTSEELIKEFKNNPDDAAELIYLASEIRKRPGDEKVLTELLVDYVERIGSKIALDGVDPSQRGGGDDLKRIIAEVKTEIVKKLGKKGLPPDVLKAVKKKLSQRMETSFNDLMAGGGAGQTNANSPKNTGGHSILKMLEECVGEGDELFEIIKKVRSSVGDRGIDENDFQQLHAEIQRYRQLEDVSEAISDNGEFGPLPDGAFPLDQLKMFMQQEIVRSRRHLTPFSVISLSVTKVIAKQPIPRGSINRDQVNQRIMTNLIRMVKPDELVGPLTKKIMLIFMPLTAYKDAKIALTRHQKSLTAKIFQINGHSISVLFAGVVTSFDSERTPDLTTFLQSAEAAHTDFSTRIKNIQDLI